MVMGLPLCGPLDSPSGFENSYPEAAFQGESPSWKHVSCRLSIMCDLSSTCLLKCSQGLLVLIANPLLSKGRRVDIPFLGAKPIRNREMLSLMMGPGVGSLKGTPNDSASLWLTPG